jgi:hypothetical protein
MTESRRKMGDVMIGRYKNMCGVKGDDRIGREETTVVVVTGSRWDLI